MIVNAVQMLDQEIACFQIISNHLLDMFSDVVLSHCQTLFMIRSLVS
jgi:hypothetical protein